MRLLDVFISPLSSGDAATVVFGFGLFLVGSLCAATAVFLVLHFRRERRRVEKRKEKEEARFSEISE